MLRPRLAIAALLTILAAAGGVTAGVISSHRTANALDAPAATGTTAGSPAATVATRSAAARDAADAGGDGAATTTRRTTAVAATGGGAPAGPPRISDPALAARHLFDAWQAGDRGLALQAASSGAVRALFAIEPSPRPRFGGCHFRSLGFDCTYGYAHDNGIWYLTMRVEGGASAGYRVVSVVAAWRFTSPDAAAGHLLDAWRQGDRGGALHSASRAAVDAMFRLASRANPPRPLGCSMAERGGGFNCDYTGAQSGVLVMHVEGGASIGWLVTAVSESTD
jgi:hypothetical protein